MELARGLGTGFGTELEMELAREPGTVLGRGPGNGTRKSTRNGTRKRPGNGTHEALRRLAAAG